MDGLNFKDMDALKISKLLSQLDLHNNSERNVHLYMTNVRVQVIATCKPLGRSTVDRRRTCCRNGCGRCGGST